MNLGWHRLIENRSALVSVIILGVISLAAICAPHIVRYSFEEQNIEMRLLGPSRDHPLGTDTLGRDQYSRVIYGARATMAVGLVTALVSLLLGVSVGAIAGFFGGWIDLVLMRIVDIFYVLPSLLLAILVMVVVGSGLTGILIALSMVGWVGVARLVRAQTLQVRQLLYVDAARAIGAGDLRIIWRHILPNLWGPIVVALSYQVPSNIMAESFLSFLGLGLQPPQSSWGTLAAEGWRAMRSYPHLIIYPGAILFVCLMAFNFVGDGLRDAFDPRQR